MQIFSTTFSTLKKSANYSYVNVVQVGVARATLCHSPLIIPSHEFIKPCPNITSCTNSDQVVTDVVPVDSKVAVMEEDDDDLETINLMSTDSSEGINYYIILYPPVYSSPKF